MLYLNTHMRNQLDHTHLGGIPGKDLVDFFDKKLAQFTLHFWC